MSQNFDVNNREAERAFVVRLRGTPPSPGTPVRQAYFVDGDPQFRIREKAGRWLITAKQGAKSERIEIEAELLGNGPELFRAAPGGGVEKVRYVDGQWEIDVFAGVHEGLVLMEIENPPVELPPFPDWVEVVREVTHDARFENVNLAKMRTAEFLFLLAEVLEPA